MRKVWFSVLLILLCSLSVFAQSFPKAELFGGYSYDRRDSANYNGWIASITENPLPYVGVKFEVSGHYLTTKNSYGKSENWLHNIVLGPQFSFRKSEKMTPFCHALIGATNQRLKTTPTTAPQSDSHTFFATVLGGGFDYNVSKSFSVRLLQADYILNRYQGDTLNNIRLSFGFVYRFAWSH
jgi:hypothetical protein